MKKICCVLALVSSLVAVPAAAEDQVGRILRIADGAPNRIVTPYEGPQLITNFPHEAWSVGSVIYLLPMEDGQSFGGFIQNKTGEFAIPVMFEVARIPPQTIHLEDPYYEPVAGGEQQPRKRSKDHVSDVVETLLEAMRNEQIPGYRQVRHEERVIYVGPIRMELKHRQRRGNLMVERHSIVNDGDESRRISEASFVVPNRMGVLIYPPLTQMAPGQEASVFIMRGL